MFSFGPNKSNVVELKTSSELRQVESYWEALRGNRVVPRRSEVDPRGIQGALANAFILERVAPSVSRVRIAGSVLNDLMGMEVRGMPLSSLFTPAARDMVHRVMNEVYETPSVASIHLVSEGKYGKDTLHAQMLIMPLRSDFGDISRALGCIVVKGKIGRAPRRFDVMGKELRPLLDRIGPEENEFAPLIETQGFAEEQNVFLSHAEARKRREASEKRIKERQAPETPALRETKVPHLKVVVTED